MLNSSSPVPPEDAPVNAFGTIPVSGPADPAQGDTTATGAPDAAPAVPRDTSPTWELEMLISGGVVFSLFQLPPVLDGLMTRWEPHVTDGASVALLVGYAYLKGALYTLIAAFVLHLGARAYWVGLMGLNSVFPGGIRWERTQLGPMAREVYRRRLPTLPGLIATIDNFASVIFSFAFLVVFVSLLSIPLMALFAGIAYGVSRYIGGEVRTAFFALAAILTVVPVSVALYDQKRGSRLDPGGRGARVLRRLTSVFYTTQLIGLLGPTLFTIGTNSRRKTTYVLFYFAMIGSVFFVLGEWMARKGLFAISGADFFSTGSAVHSVSYARYESQWPEEYVNEAEPSIQSDVIRDPYLRLFIPYQPRRHNAGVAERCPDVRPLQKRGLRITRSGLRGVQADSASEVALRCLSRMHAVTVNGITQANLRFRFATHPQTGVDGMLAYLPTGALPRGENVLTVMPPPRSPTSSNKRPLQPYIIPFWL